METTFEETEYVDELTLNTLKSCVERTMQITGATTSFEAMTRLGRIEGMINKRAEQLKFAHVGGLEQKVESILDKYAKQEKYYSEFKEYSLSLIKAVELMLMHGLEPESEEQSFQLKTILSTIRGAHEELSLWRPGDEFPCEF